MALQISAVVAIIVIILMTLNNEARSTCEQNHSRDTCIHMGV